MAIVTISRGTFAGGARLAELLGQRLGYQTVSREALYQKVQQDYGITEDELIQIMTWAPTHVGPGGDRRRRLFAAIQAALCALLEDDGVVYHGQAGHLLLPDIDHVVRVRLIAPRTLRIEMAMEREGLSPHQASLKIDQVDSERARWTEFVFGANWADPGLYDLVLNLDRITLESATRLVCETVNLQELQPNEASRRRMAQLALRSAVLARLLGDPATADMGLSVEVEDRRVTITGPVDPRHHDLVRQVVARVDGVDEIRIAGPHA